MSPWQDGYITDIPYTTGFYRELSPAYLSMLALLMGVRPPAILDREYTYCELGCGQGLSTLLLAAANPLGRFYGYDFNPSQIAKANELAQAAGVHNVGFFEESFASLAAKTGPDAPKFDVIVLHGIYSWVSAENRRHIVTVIRDRLKPGGMVYVSYNCMPGWAPFAPVQRLMREYAKRRAGRSDHSVMAAVDFANELVQKGSRYFAVNESATRNLSRMAGKDRTYLAHEYLNEHWEALFHLDVAEQMKEARLEYIGSATISDNVLALSAPRELAEMITTADSAMAETIKDFASNRQFRRDLFVRGPVRLTNMQFAHELGLLSFTLTVNSDRTTLKLSTAAGELSANESVTGPIVERLKDGTSTFADVTKLPTLASSPPWQTAQALSLLVESGQAHPTLPAVSGHSGAHALNSVLIHRSRHDDAIQFLAAPLIGSGVFVAHAELLILLGLEIGEGSESGRLASFVWNALREQGKRLMKDGEPLEGDLANLAEIEVRVKEFLEHRIPLLRRLGVVESSAA